jgi:tRNA A-37 threonylcarbamoyl transferase component Bud32
MSAVPDPQIVEQVWMALDDGVAEDFAALREVVQGSDQDLRAALAAVRRYQRRLATERTGSAAPATAPDGMLPPGTVLGDYRIEGVHGAGAMGVVYRARQLSLGRLAALKVLPQHLRARDPRFVERFRREAAAAAGIHHPHIAEVYGFVDTGDTLAYAMRFVPGPSLHEVLQALANAHVAPVRPTTLAHVRRCVQLVRALADALAVIHAAGLVHRDVKPGNVLLEGGGSEPLSGSPVLVDFGLVRPAGESDLTNTNTVLGTLAYASHESTLGQTVDARADVFSLGATLHDLLTTTAPSTRAPATAGLPEARSINPTIDAGLAAIVAMALQPDRALRYEHGGAFRDELDCWLRGDPIRALPASAFGRFQLWRRRNPLQALRVAGLVLLLALLLAGAMLLLVSVFDLQRTATQARAAEARGDLRTAAAAFSALRRSDLAGWLPWLAGPRSRAAEYCTAEGALQPIAAALAEAAAAAAAGNGNAEVAAVEDAGEHACRALFCGEQASVRDAVYAHLLRAAGPASPIPHRIAAFDAWTNLLLAQEQLPAPTAVPTAALHDLARATLADPAAAAVPELAAAACSTLACLRTCAAFRSLVELLASARTLATAEQLRALANYQFAWCATADRSALLDLDPEVLETWAASLEPWANAGIEFLQTAGQLLWWQESRSATARPVALRVPATMQAAMHALCQQPDPTWRRTHVEPQRYDACIWMRPYGQEQIAARLFPDEVATTWRAAPMTGSFRVLRGDGATRPQAHLEGTLLAAGVESCRLRNGDGDNDPPYVRFDRPGYSRLVLRSRVPGRVYCLTVRCSVYPGTRTPLRLRGTGHYRLRVHAVVAGRPVSPPLLTVESTASIDPAGGPHPGDMVSLPTPHLTDVPEVEIVFEYVRGNTTLRVRGVTLEWQVH